MLFRKPRRHSFNPKHCSHRVPVRMETLSSLTWHPVQRMFVCSTVSWILHSSHTHIYVRYYQYLQQNGWNVLHHSCASHTHNLEILRWLLEEFSHCDQLKNEDFLNQVKQVQFSVPFPLISLLLFFLLLIPSFFLFDKLKLFCRADMKQIIHFYIPSSGV